MATILYSFYLLNDSACARPQFFKILFINLDIEDPQHGTFMLFQGFREVTRYTVLLWHMHRAPKLMDIPRTNNTLRSHRP